MIVGTPKETLNREYRVGLTPSIAKTLVNRGHRVLVEDQAGCRIGFPNEAYQQAGAQIVSAEEVFGRSELLIKVKEPTAKEAKQLHENQIIFTFLHLAANLPLVKQLKKSKVTAIAYEGVEKNGQRILLQPMSEIAGRLSAQAAAHYLQCAFGGQGVLMSGLAGVPAANICIFGGGIVGENAAKIALGMGAKVTIIDKNIDRLGELRHIFNENIETLLPDPAHIVSLLPKLDAIIGAVLIPGDKAPRLLEKEDLKLMKPGSVLVDVAIDQGGCFATSRPTTHDKPVYMEEGVSHYCVSNMPGAVAKTATLALTNSTRNYIVELANQGMEAIEKNEELKAGLAIHNGKIFSPPIANLLGETAEDIEQLNG